MTQRIFLIGALVAPFLFPSVSMGQAKQGDFVTGAMTRSSFGAGSSGLLVTGDLTLQGGYMLTDHFEIGAYLGGAITTFNFQQNLNNRWNTGLYTRYHYTWGMWQPYIFTGIGYESRNVNTYNLDGTLTEELYGADLGADVGLGLQYWFKPDFSIFTEAQYRYIFHTLREPLSRPGGDFIWPSLGVRWNISGRNRLKKESIK